MKARYIILISLLFAQTLFSLDLSIHGDFRTRTLNQSQYIVNGITDEWIDSRGRIFFDFKGNNNLKFVLGLEIGDLRWGNTDAGMPRDGYNVQTKHLYLNWDPDNHSTLRIGLQELYDSFNSSIFDEDAPGITYLYKGYGLNLKLGYIILIDRHVDSSKDDHYFMFIDNSYKLNNQTLLKGAFYYSTYSKYQGHSDRTLYFGAGFEHSYGNLEIGSQFIYQYTQYDDHIYDDLKGYFAYAYGKYEICDGSYIKLNFGYVPGDDDFSDRNATGFYGIDGEDFLLVYDLEYSFLGTINISHNRYGFTSYGFPYEGLTVISFFYSRSPFFSAIGNLRANSNALSNMGINKNLGTELNLGTDFFIMNGLRFRAVGAWFLPGKYFHDKGHTRKTGWMFTSNLQYNF